MNHVMIDIETMATSEDAAITSIGACTFNAHSILDDVFYRNIRVDAQQLMFRRLVDRKTLDWWSQRKSPAVYELLKSMSGEAVGLCEALDDLRQYVKKQGKINGVWAKPPHFDISILNHAYRTTGIEAPWQHRRIYCVRTLMATVQGKVEWEQGDHNALHDAIAQAKNVQKVWRA